MKILKQRIIGSSNNYRYSKNMRYRYGRDSFSISYEDNYDIYDPNDSFEKFRAQVVPIRPYDDAEYVWAKISNGSISYILNGKEINKDYYFNFLDMGDEESDFDDASEWMYCIFEEVCATLIQMNDKIDPEPMV